MLGRHQSLQVCSGGVTGLQPTSACLNHSASSRHHLAGRDAHSRRALDLLACCIVTGHLSSLCSDGKHTNHPLLVSRQGHPPD